MNPSPSPSDTTISIPPSSEEDIELFDLSTLTPIPLVRLSDKPQYLIYENGILVDQDGNPATPEEYNTTHAEILRDMQKYRHVCNTAEDAEFMALIDKYAPQLRQEKHEPPTHPALRRQYNYPGYLTYVDGELVDHSGSPTTPEKYHTTHAEILVNMFQKRQSSLVYEDEEGNTEFLEVLHKYVPESVSLSPEEYYKLATPSPHGCITHYIDSSGNMHKREITLVVGGVSNTLRQKIESRFNV